MVFTTIIKDAVREETLNKFDTYTFIGFGSGTASPSENDTDLTSPIIRKETSEQIKNISAGTYEFSANLGLTEGNGNDISEIGLFDSSSGGNMAVKRLLNNVVSKSDSVELSVGLRLNVEVN